MRQDQHPRPVAIFLNCSRLDYDHQLDFSRLETLTDFHRHNTDYVTDTNEIIQLVNDANAEIVITKEMQVPPEAVHGFRSNTVKLLCEAGTGYNNIPLQACRDKNIVVCNIPTYSTEAVAHTAITYIMNFAINLLEQQRMLHNNDRSNFTGPFTLPLVELGGKTLGLVGGSGMIGSKVADIALALGMKIIISSRSGTLPSTHRLYQHPDVTITSDVNILLQQSDFVSIHTPLNDETRGTFGRTQIEQMKPTAFLINTSRGKVCNEEELIQCMQEGKIAGAGLDVTASEPPPMDSPIWNLNNVWLSPHIGWRRKETRQRLVDMTCDNIQAYIHAKGNVNNYINVVNRDPFRMRREERSKVDRRSFLMGTCSQIGLSTKFPLLNEYRRSFTTKRRQKRRQSQHTISATKSKQVATTSNKRKTEPTNVIRPPKGYQKRLPKPERNALPPTLLTPTASPYVYVSQTALVDSENPSEMIDASTLFQQSAQLGISGSILSRDGSFEYFSPKHDLKHEYPDHGAPEVAVLGRSNVGKSSLVNAILQKDLCITSKSPGRTRLPYYYGWTPNASLKDKPTKAGKATVNKDPALVRGYIVDLPGYGFGSAPIHVVEEWQKDTQDWLLHRRHEAKVLKRLYLLMDSRRDEPNDWDRAVLRWLEDAEIPYTIVLTKADRVSVPQVVKQVNNFCIRYASQEAEMESNMGSDEYMSYVAQSPVVHVTSSKQGWGIADLMWAIETEFIGDTDESLGYHVRQLLTGKGSYSGHMEMLISASTYCRVLAE
ncbi:oxidoreductase [Nitzschia inconspicua]|uniref:Oxidoreductase n=1 Tax=Nitzschia inconspicua TaxID=303405 RepID=A0A9K3PLH7_9STRA|nr:oxidoreductase [Nitzschia inconspicua]